MKNTGFNYTGFAPGYATKYVLPKLLPLISGDRKKILDIGCGNGAVARELEKNGHEVWGCDWDQAGVDLANRAQAGRFTQWDLNRDPRDFPFSKFDLVISSEVIEHLFYPRNLFRLAHHVLPTDGRFIITTPYHGYLKNLALSLLNKWDWHHNVFHDGGHIKFFSFKTLIRMMSECGFYAEGWLGCGRFPALYKSMIAWGYKKQ